MSGSLGSVSSKCRVDQVAWRWHSASSELPRASRAGSPLHYHCEAPPALVAKDTRACHRSRACGCALQGLSYHPWVALSAACRQRVRGLQMAPHSGGGHPHASGSQRRIPRTARERLLDSGADELCVSDWEVGRGCSCSCGVVCLAVPSRSTGPVRCPLPLQLAKGRLYRPREWDLRVVEDRMARLPSTRRAGEWESTVPLVTPAQRAAGVPRGGGLLLGLPKALTLQRRRRR